MNTISVGQAYLFQAQEDLRAAKMVGSDIASAPSSFYMLLQMVFEKLAKAYMYRNTNLLPKRFGHEAADKHFSKMIDAMIRSNPSKRKYYKYLIGLIKELEVHNLPLPRQSLKIHHVSNIHGKIKSTLFVILLGICHS